jgi:Na+:H+ antiporter, NhaA family
MTSGLLFVLRVSWRSAATGNALVGPPTTPGDWMTRTSAGELKPPISPARRLLQPLERFLHVEAAGGVVLLIAAAVALVWANSPWAASYEHVWHAPVTLGIAGWVSKQSLHFWINEGLMTIFFLVVGLEIRREIHEGALASARQAALPVIAAIGGVLAPAAIYFGVNYGDPMLRGGWAVPTATDIAFAVGVLALLGRRVPSELRVLLLAMAIIDDIAAIIIIAVFYSSGVSLVGLAIAAGGVLSVFAFQWSGIRSAWPYVVPGGIIWAGILIAGVHPAIAGVIAGLMTPVRQPHVIGNPASRVEAALHPWVAFGIMPLFALANAGVSFGDLTFNDPTFTGMLAGVGAGLVIGKPLGIVLAAALGVRLGLCSLPQGVGKAGILAVGCLAGIGFTMAIFIADLAFDDPGLLVSAKFSILIASTVAAVVGLLAARFAVDERSQ